MQIKPDNVLLTSLLETYLNYDTKTGTITISGSVANLGTANFTTTIAVGRSQSIADIYAINRNTGLKMSLNAGSIHHPYQDVSSENHAHSINYTDGIITVTLSVSNFTGAGIVLTSQVWDVVVVLYNVPY